MPNKIKSLIIDTRKEKGKKHNLEHIKLKIKCYETVY